MVEALLFVGLLVAVFVGFNIGGSSTGVSFDPTVGSGVLGKLVAAALMTGFAFLDGWTLGREVVAEMGGGIVPQSEFALAANVVILFFVGPALLVSSTFGVPASTSMTAAGAIAGLDLANESLDSHVMLEIISWWVITPVIAFWVYAVIGRYIYPYLDAQFGLDQSLGALVRLDHDGGFPRPRLGLNTTYHGFGSTVLIVIVACYMTFPTGASNVANVIAPLVGNDAFEMSIGILIAGGAIDLDAFTIARRTLDTVSNDLTQLPILVALTVETVSASLTSFLSAIGIPASLAVNAMIYIVGLDWGRATRTVTLGEALSDDKTPQVSVNALTVEHEDGVPKVDEEAPGKLSTQDLFDPGTTRRIIFFWMLTPPPSAFASYILFSTGII